MFTVLGTWEVIGEVQGERYTAINIHSSGWEIERGGGARSSVQEEKCKQRRAGWHRENSPFEFHRKVELLRLYPNP